MKSIRIIISLSIITLMMACFTNITNGQSIVGDWYGKAGAKGNNLRISLHIKTDGKAYTCTWDSPDQNAMGLPVTTTSFTYPDFTFTYDEAGIKYAGKVNSGYTEIKGTLFQSGMEIEIIFGRKQIPAATGTTGK